MPLFISNEELSLISHDAVAVAKKANKYIRQLKAELAEVQALNHQLHLQSIEKDEEISELRESKRQLIDSVEEKEATIKNYVDKIALESTTITRIEEQKMDQNPRKRQAMKSGRDRISELPDTIVCEILSRLPTKRAVATSILSKRWKVQWTYCFNLDFKDSHFYRFNPESEVKKTFSVIVKDVISLNKSPCIKKFQLTSETMGVSDVTACLDSILRRNVVEIQLDVSLDGDLDIPFMLPKSLFTCRTLVFLDLTSGTLYDFPYDFPPWVHLPSLKVFRVSFYDPSNVVMTELFCGLPVLEDLSVYIYGDSKEKMILNIFTPSLKRLRLDLDDVLDYKIVVRAPRLKELDICDNIIANYVFKELPMHVKTRLRVGKCARMVKYEDKEYAPKLAIRAIQLMNGISGVKSLALSSCILWIQDFGNVVVFPNVTCLEMDITYCCGFTYLPYLNDRFPNLVFLALEMTPEHLGHVPLCLLLHLKRIMVKGFYNKECELKSLEDLLKVAEVLDEVVICTHNMALKERKNLHLKLSSFHRSAKNCQFRVKKQKL